ncbi:MAG: TIGR04086 family membrane protein [Lachnospira sp.]|nr:TIGR04086 family membrane protein [Lachnospira sp.]
MQKKIIADAAKVLILGYILTVVMLLILAFLLYKMQLSQGQIKIGIVVIYVLSTLVCGFIMAKLRKNKRVMWGFVMGLIYFMVLMIVSFVMNRGFNSDVTNIFAILASCVGGGIFGAIIS